MALGPGPSTIFQSWLGELTLDTFVREYWARKTLHVPGALERFADLHSGLFDDQGIRELLWQLARTPDHLRNIAAYPRTANADRHSEAIGDATRVQVAPAAVLPLLDAGATIAIYGLDTVQRRFAEITEAMRVDLGLLGRFSANLWLSQPSSGMITHFDAMPAMQCQVRGRKTWRVAPTPAVDWPKSAAIRASDGTADYGHGTWDSDTRIVPDEEFQTLELTPGDFLYMPAGTWHATQCATDDLSVGIGFFFRPTRMEDVLREIIVEQFENDLAWRTPLPPMPGQAGPKSMAPELAQFLAERSSQLLDVLSTTPTSDLRWQVAASRAGAKSLPNRHAGWLHPQRSSVHPKDELMLNPQHPTTHASGQGDEGHDVLFIYHGDEEICFDEPELMDFGRGLVQLQTSFTAEASCAWKRDGDPYPWSVVQPMLEELVRVGVLIRRA